MVPFMPYFLGEEVPPTRRMVTIQKCVRAGGKHNDLDDIGRTNRHFTFFEMMGNFSFGDYFKAEAIPWAWEFVTEVLGLEREKLWVTVHVSDDEAAEIWQSSVGVPPERIQRLDKDNWWAAGDVGPCGPCSEIFYDLGPELGDGGGPAHGGEDRFVEIWNLVFMQFAADGTGDMTPLEAPGIDTGAGLERILAVLQGVPAAWDIDLFAPPAGRGRAHLRQDLRRRSRDRCLDAHLRRPRPHDGDAHLRRRVPLQRRPWLCTAPHHPPRRAPCLGARRHRCRDAAAGRGSLWT